MKIEVRYYTKSGNTKKLAEAIAQAVGVHAETVDVPISEHTDVLFLGSSVYAAGVDDAVKQFVARLDPKLVGKVVNFSTSTLLPSTYKQIKELVENRGIAIEQKEYHCRGSFAFLHKNKPDDSDLQAIAAFAKESIR